MGVERYWMGQGISKLADYDPNKLQIATARPGRIIKTYGPISSGTRCEILSYPAGHGYLTVRVGPFSEAFYNQNHPLCKQLKTTNGVFDIEGDLVEETNDV